MKRGPVFDISTQVGQIGTRIRLIEDLDKDKRKGKGRYCSLGGRIDSYLCRANYFEPGRFEE